MVRGNAKTCNTQLVLAICKCFTRFPFCNRLHQLSAGSCAYHDRPMKRSLIKHLSAPLSLKTINVLAITIADNKKRFMRTSKARHRSNYSRKTNCVYGIISAQSTQKPRATDLGSFKRIKVTTFSMTFISVS